MEKLISVVSVSQDLILHCGNLSDSYRLPGYAEDMEDSVHQVCHHRGSKEEVSVSTMSYRY